MVAPQPDTLDLSGLTCPQLVLRLADALRDRPTGREVAVIATDPLSTIDIPFFLDRHGHKLLRCAHEGGRIVFRIETAGAKAATV